MKTQYIRQDGIVNGIDFDAHYQVKGWHGIAFFLLGFAATSEPITCLAVDEDGNEYEAETGEFDQVTDPDNVIAVMVGDDRRHTVSIEDLIPLREDGFCRGCGQVGCTHNVYE